MLQAPTRAKLNLKLDMLRMHGDTLFPQLLTGTDTPGILKLRVKGNVQLRPMLCKGPLAVEKEYTLLVGATEVGGKLKPKGVDATAAKRKQEVAADPKNRRIEHERVR